MPGRTYNASRSSEIRKRSIVCDFLDTFVTLSDPVFGWYRRTPLASMRHKGQ
jgi:hypothetical protein